MTYYSTPAAVIRDSGIKPADMGFKDIEHGQTKDEQLTAKVEEWLTAAKAYIDANRRRNFSAELVAGTITEIPVCINDIARRIAVNMAKQVMLNRDSPVVKVDEYTIKITDSGILTKDIKDDLMDCSPKKPKIRMFRVGGCDHDHLQH